MDANQARRDELERRLSGLRQLERHHFNLTQVRGIDPESPQAITAAAAVASQQSQLAAFADVAPDDEATRILEVSAAAASELPELERLLAPDGQQPAAPSAEDAPAPVEQISEPDPSSWDKFKTWLTS